MAILFSVNLSPLADAFSINFSINFSFFSVNPIVLSGNSSVNFTVTFSATFGTVIFKMNSSVLKDGTFANLLYVIVNQFIYN